MPDPRELLVCLLDYIKEQTKEVDPKGYRLASSKGFLRSAAEIVEEKTRHTGRPTCVRPCLAEVLYGLSIGTGQHRGIRGGRGQVPNTRYRLARGRAVPKTRPAAAKRRAHSAAREWRKGARSAYRELGLVVYWICCSIVSSV